MIGEVRFELTADHVKLLRHAYTSWDDAEFGAPCIDPKRPYGNSDVIGDVHAILGWTIPEECDERYLEDEGRDKVRKIHKELETALQVVLRAGSFEPGVYVARRYFNDWQRETPAAAPTKETP